MKPDNSWKHFLLAFLLAVICYALFYEGIEHRRTRRGPWQITFTNSPAGNPALVINEPALALTNVELTFADQPPVATNRFGTRVFSQPQPVPFDLPFGQCIFIDSTFLPGTVVFQMFGHEIQLLPRVLMIDQLEHPWRTEETITLHAPPVPSSKAASNPVQPPGVTNDPGNPAAPR